MDVVGGILRLEGLLRQILHEAAGGEGDPGLGIHLADGDPLGSLAGGDEDGRGADDDARPGAVLGPLGDGGDAHVAEQDGDEHDARRHPAASQEPDQVFESHV
jgi:hypothetical protein